MKTQDMQEKLDSLAALLSEHGDAVLVLFSRHSGNATQLLSGQSGNKFAVAGMAKCFLDREDIKESASFEFSEEMGNIPDWEDSMDEDSFGGGPEECSST